MLRACSDVLDLDLAEQVHGLIEKYGFRENLILRMALVDVCGKCLAMGDARRVFESIVEPNEVCWNVIVRRYLESGRVEDAMVMFFRLIGEGVRPLNHTVSQELVRVWWHSREGIECGGTRGSCTSVIGFLSSDAK